MRPILLAMNNPLSGDPAHALFPMPERCTGHRLWRMLHERSGATRSQYLAAFDRRNLVHGREWSQPAARASAAALLAELDGSGATVVVFGEKPRQALGLDRMLLHPQTYFGVTWRQLPHPSGRCHWYNDPVHRAIAGMLLEELAEAGHG